MDCFKDSFRTLLSLSGVCTGIFSIVAVLTLVDSLKTTIHEGFESFGTDMVFIEKEPVEPDLNEEGVFKWWEYVSRPPVTYSEYNFLRNHSELSGKMAFSARFADYTAVAGDWDLLVPQNYACGRSLSENEVKRGSAVIVLGHNAAERLFNGSAAALGKSVRIADKNFTVTGVLEKCGAATVSPIDIDNARIIPVKAAQSIVDLSRTRTSICSMPEGNADSSEHSAELRKLMRSSRRLLPEDKDNFAVNRISYLIDQTREIFSLANMLGWIIGSFSLLVGGFSIANIMFVSVQERRAETGIQRALGANRRTILKQFLQEAVFLSLCGGAAGIILVLLGTACIPSELIKLRLSAGNVFLGLVLSLAIGILSGMAPALSASRMNPVDAMSVK